MREYIIIANKPGQLGNRLVVFAHFIAFAADKKMTIINPSFDEYANLFESTAAAFVSSFPVPVLFKMHGALSRLLFRLSNLTARIGRRLKVNNALMKVVYLDWSEQFDLDRIGSFQTTFCLVDGWKFRGNEIVKRNKKVIIDFFTPAHQYREAVDTFMKKNRGNLEIIVGIHIRHGDYEKFLNGKYFYTVAQYVQVMTTIARLFRGKELKFLVCTNVKLNKGDFKELPIVYGPGTPILDLYCLAACDFIAGPPSTFTSWASFYGEVPLYFIENPEKEMSESDFKIIEIP